MRGDVSIDFGPVYVHRYGPGSLHRGESRCVTSGSDRAPSYVRSAVNRVYGRLSGPSLARARERG